MNSMEFDKYDKKCNVIKNLILKVYRNDKFDFIRNPETLYIEVVINNTFNITLLPDNNWNEIKRHIDKKIIFQRNKRNDILEDCIICCESIQTNITCPKCSNNWCGDCYINLFKTGKGVITCPHCRFSFGDRMCEDMIQMAVNEIKYKLGK
jgi:hypothetical protein